jgi:DNA-binding transcriptional MerR regulator
MGNNYKEYATNLLKKLVMVKKLMGPGFTLKEVTEYLELMGTNSATSSNLAGKVNEKGHLSDRKIAELREVKNAMIDIVTDISVAANRKIQVITARF